VRLATQAALGERVVEPVDVGRCDGLAAVDEHVDVVQPQQRAFGRRRAGSRVGVGEAGRRRDRARVGRQRLQPPHRTHEERAGVEQHHRYPGDQRRRGAEHQAHVVEQRQPGHAHRPAVRRLEALDGLARVGEHVAVREHDAGRRAGRAGGVLQVRDVVRHLAQPPGLRGQGVDRDRGRTGEFALGTEALDVRDAGRGGQQQGRRAVGEHRREPLVVPWQPRRVQRHGDEPGPDHREEGRDVVRRLLDEDRDPVAGRAPRLDARRDLVDPRVQLRPGQRGRDPAGIGGVVHEGQCGLVALPRRPLPEQHGQRGDADERGGPLSGSAHQSLAEWFSGAGRGFSGAGRTPDRRW
jgi:hypothetical protein